MMQVLFETDWLASEPVFYNEETGQASHNINDVINYANLEFHPEGFNNYLDFGYSVFEQTPVKHVKFLRYSSRLLVDASGQLHVEYLPDPVEQWLGRVSHEDDVLHLLEYTIRCWEKSVDGEIIIPTSGGYDSRLLNFMIEDKSRVRSFSYGISDNQQESYEVVYPRKLSQILGTRWEPIELGDYHRYFDVWDRLFGISTHAHGMYHLEFYSKILPRVQGGNPLLSGIIGDAWAGSVEFIEIGSMDQLPLLGYTHGMHADSRYSLLQDDGALRHSYFNKMGDRIGLPLYNVVEAMRLKIILLSYLLRVPAYFGFKPWSPFLNESIALGMVTLPDHRRKARLWQKEFFQKKGLDLESMNLPVNYQNSLNYQAMQRVPVTPLNAGLLREVLKPDYVYWINRCVQPEGRLWSWLRRNYLQMIHIPGVWRVSQWLKLESKLTEEEKQRLPAYCAYLTLKPIEILLQRRNLARQEEK